jgi:hypothetical protein
VPTHRRYVLWVVWSGVVLSRVCQEIGNECYTACVTAFPVAIFPRSRLREPEVVAAASGGLVEIRLGSDAESLGMLPMRVIRAHEEVRQLAQTFVRAMVALRQDDPSPVLLGDVAYVAEWSVEDRERFIDGFAEAIAESLRTDDPAAARFFVQLMGSREAEYRSPQFDGDVSDDVADALETRVGLRR